jgi:O-antigen/teichoic acid export membrane protein
VIRIISHLRTKAGFRLADWLPARVQEHLRRLRQPATEQSFFGNVTVMLAGTVAGQTVSILLSPVLTRLFTPEEFGHLSVYNSILSLLTTIASLGLELAIPICLADIECANLLALCGIALAATTGLVGIVSWLIPLRVLNLLSIGSLASYRYLLPVGLVCLGGYYIMLAVATRAGAFSSIARTRISQGLSGPVSQMLLGVLGAGTPGLIIGYVIGQSSGTLLLFVRFVLGRREWLRQITWRRIAAVGRRYIAFPLFSSWTRLLDEAGGGLILFVLFAACYSPAISGFMFISERVVMRPMMIISTSLLQVFIGEAGRTASQNPAQLRRRFRQVVPLQFLLATTWILAANLVAGWAFPRLFGVAWANAIPYLRALSLAYLLQIVLHPVSGTLQLLERQAMAAVWQICRLVLVLIAVLVPWRSGTTAVSALWISALTETACCLTLLALMASTIEQAVARQQKGGRSGRLAPL